MIHSVPSATSNRSDQHSYNNSLPELRNEVMPVYIYSDLVWGKFKEWLGFVKSQYNLRQTPDLLKIPS